MTQQLALFCDPCDVAFEGVLELADLVRDDWHRQRVVGLREPQGNGWEPEGIPLAYMFGRPVEIVRLPKGGAL